MGCLCGFVWFQYPVLRRPINPCPPFKKKSPAEQKPTQIRFSLTIFRSNPRPIQRTMSDLQVIGAGLGRTATMSLKAALTRLGYKPYHMDEVRSARHQAVWAEVARAEMSGDRDASRVAEARDKVAAMLAADGYTATTDYPTCLLYMDHLARYPNAKVILSVRSNPGAWATSVSDTIFRMLVNAWRPPISLLAPHVGALSRWFFHSHGLLEEAAGVGVGVGGDGDGVGGDDGDSDDGDCDKRDPTKLVPKRMPSRASLERAYSEWVEAVKANVPADRLLVHNAKDGWGPLCEFLGVPETDRPSPTEPYPRSNSSAQLKVDIDAVEFVTNHFWHFSGLLGVAVVLGAVTRPSVTVPQLLSTPALTTLAVGSAVALRVVTADRLKSPAGLVSLACVALPVVAMGAGGLASAVAWLWQRVRG